MIEQRSRCHNDAYGVFYYPVVQKVAVDDKVAASAAHAQKELDWLLWP